VRFEWDPAKARANRAKHGVPFEVASRVFDDPIHVSLADTDHLPEERWKTFGVANGLLLLVVHTWSEGEDGEVVRIISARRARRSEWRLYGQGS
jgi:hypothetical protein